MPSNLSALGPEYSSLVTVVTARLEPIYVCGLLINHELLYSTTTSTSDTPPLANIVSTVKPIKPIFPPPYSGHGHSRGGGRFSNQNRSSTICHVCNHVGHPALNCYHCQNVSSYPPNRPTAHTATQKNINAWFLDSRATHYITPNLDNHLLQTPYNGTDTVQIGNGTSLPINHTSSSIFQSSSNSFHLQNILHVQSMTKNLLSINSK